jgi:CheY-like chemotaxis protein
MSMQFSAEDIARIRDDARVLIRRADVHEESLEGLVRATDTEVRDAEAAFSHALSGEAAIAPEWQTVCEVRLSRSRQNADAAKRACVSARQQQVAARRLHGRLADHSDVGRMWTGTPAVLVVDDAEDLRELVAYVLRDAGFVVRTAANGVEALFAAYEMQPAVIVMDLKMPLLDGIEATRLIKATEATRHAKIIAHTADPSLPDPVIQRLFVAILPKPSPPDVLLTAVQSVANL